MDALSELPPEQRAVLSLILERRKGYDEIAAILGIDAFAVRARAHSALDSLAPLATSELTPSRRAELCDYLLDQQDDEAYEATYRHLQSSAPSREWARAVAAQLSEMAPDALPEIPKERSNRQSSSRLGGILLIAAVAIGIAVGAYLIFFNGEEASRSSSSTTTPTLTSTDATQNARPVAQINLLPPSGSESKAAGLAQVLAAGNQRAIVIAGQGVAPGTYAVWLYTDGSNNKLLGFVPTAVTSTGKFAAQAALPAGAGVYKELVVTTQPVPKNAQDVPKAPGEIVLRGALKGVPAS